MTETPATVPSRFDYVAYDETAATKQATLKAAAQNVETALTVLEASRAAMIDAIEDLLPETENRSRAYNQLNDATGPDVEDALGLLEQAYMWCGKAIRDDQIERNGGAPLQEGRSNS